MNGALRRHVQRYKTVLMEGGRVLLVGHSQGCLYANSAYAALASDSDDMPMRSFGILAVGTPSGQVASGGPHITLTNDPMINTVRWFYRGTLDGNVTNSSDSSDWKNHSFVYACLDGDRSGPMIVNLALARANGLAGTGDGADHRDPDLGAEPDVDLHVFEPGGIHVYYAASWGTSGYLDTTT